MPSFFALASIFVLAQAAGVSTPSPIAIRLESNVTECPSTSELQSSLGQLLGGGSLSGAPWVLAYRRDPASAGRDDDASLVMEVVAPSGERLAERRIAATRRDCPAIAGAMAAVATRSLRALGWTRGEPLPVSVQQPAAARSPQPIEEGGKPASREPAPRLILGAGPSLGTSPRAGTNFSLAARLRATGRIYVQLGGGLLSGSESQRAGPGTARLTSRYFNAATLVAIGLGRLELLGGPIALVSFDQGSSSGLVHGGSGERATLAVGLTIAGSLRLSSRWRLGAELEGFRAAWGPDYAVQVGGTRTVVLAPSPWTAIAALRLEFVAWQ